ncbi:unnamed protein product [Closterium sp. NIES-64]|nr:unnamed protein product [Closterium sp. NIES-64]
METGKVGDSAMSKDGMAHENDGKSAVSEDDDGTSERPTELADASAVSEDDDGTGELAHAQSTVNEDNNGTVSSPMQSECISS